MFLPSYCGFSINILHSVVYIDLTYAVSGIESVPESEWGLIAITFNDEIQFVCLVCDNDTLSIGTCWNMPFLSISMVCTWKS